MMASSSKNQYLQAFPLDGLTSFCSPPGFQFDTIPDGGPAGTPTLDLVWVWVKQDKIE